MTQPDHAALATELARHWTFAGLAGDSDAEFLAAVAAHDAGWREVDSAPRFHPDGSPVSFLEWPLVEVVNIWRRPIAEAVALGETARHVVARHFCLLAESVRSRTSACWRKAYVAALFSQTSVRCSKPFWVNGRVCLARRAWRA